MNELLSSGLIAASGPLTRVAEVHDGTQEGGVTKYEHGNEFVTDGRSVHDGEDETQCASVGLGSICKLHAANSTDLMAGSI